jgi:ribonuclease P/MRP protein subunit RPP1
MPGPLTAHIISLDLSSQPRLPFYLKHTLIRTAIRNGAVFEIPYALALSPNDEHKRRNWWANAREVARVTHGKSILLSGGGQTIADLRAPLDVANV